MYAGTANTVSIVLGLDLKMVLGRNSPVKSTTIVDNKVSAVTRAPSANEENSVASKMCANKMP
jgi:hypothetical protein